MRVKIGHFVRVPAGLRPVTPTATPDRWESRRTLPCKLCPSFAYSARLQKGEGIRVSPLDAIARTTRHKPLSVLMGYVRRAEAFDDVALTSIIA